MSSASDSNPHVVTGDWYSGVYTPQTPQILVHVLQRAAVNDHDVWFHAENRGQRLAYPCFHVFGFSQQIVLSWFG